ncbi:hypothetical protein ACFXO9_09420 [Nocardia tengchongensis]|uniref:hypothetical protein n=1 Tax=Nocardia tengchongensis TaxID=2055889 RepID=UPI0036B5E6C1
MKTRTRRAGIGMAGFVALASVVGIGSPMASADTTGNGLTISGDTYYVNQTYTITAIDPAAATGTLLSSAWFYDNGPDNNPNPSPRMINQNASGQTLDAGIGLIPSPSGGPRNPVNDPHNPATLTWTPTTTGSHTLLAKICQVVQTPAGTCEVVGPITVNVTTAPTSSTGSANSIPIIGPLLSSLSAK